MASVTLLPTAIGDDHKYASIPSNYQLTNIVGKDSTSSSYGGINLTTGSNAESYFFIEFDASEIPSTATIKSITAKVKVYNSSNAISRTGTRTVQLYSGTSTAKGSAQSWSDSGSQVITISSPGTWTRAELDDLCIRCYYKRNSSSSTTSTQVYVQGADITIEYEDKPLVKHTLTIQTNGYDVTPSTGGEYTEGESVEVSISADPLPTITLDGADITSQFTLKPSGGTFSGAPSASSSTGLSSGSNNVANAVGKTAENPASSSSVWYGSSSATVDSQYAQYTFDLSSIPSNATDIQVACKVAGKAESSTYSHQSGGRYSVWGLCSNGTAKGEQIHATSTSVSVLEFTDTGSWTRTELSNLQLRHYVGYYGGATAGATLTVTYSLPGSGTTYVCTVTMDSDHELVFVVAGPSNTLYVKQSGSWKKVSKVYQKSNGHWTEVSDIAALFAECSNNTNSGYFFNK